MSGRMQAGFAVALAIGLHVVTFSLRPEPVGAVATGAGGEDLVSLQAANAALSELIAQWDQPPAAAPEPIAELMPPASADTSPDIRPPDIRPPDIRPSVEPAPAQRPSPEALAYPDLAQFPPSADVSLPPPLPPEPIPEPVPERSLLPEPPLKPKARPDDLATRKPEPKPATARKAAKTADQPAEMPTNKAAERPAEKLAERPAPNPGARQPSVAQNAHRAAGAGGGLQAGEHGMAPAGTLSPAKLNDLKSSWGASIRSRIERRKAYPAAARGASGTVTVRLTVTRSGQLGGVSVVSSSGHPALDQAALNAVQSAATFPAAPKGLADASYTFTLPMKFAR